MASEPAPLSGRPRDPSGPGAPPQSNAWRRQALIGRLTIALLGVGSIRGLTEPRRRPYNLTPTIYN